MRSLPLLRQRMKPAERLTSLMSRPISSETRMPVAYSSSSMAWSRKPFSSTHLGCSRNSSTSRLVRISGYLRSTFMATTDLAGLVLTAPVCTM